MSSEKKEGNDESSAKSSRAIPFIIGSVFCERFSFYGMRSILVVYMANQLLFDENKATLLYHMFAQLIHLFCIIGAILADSYIGKFKTILWSTVVAIFGLVTITIGSIQMWIHEYHSESTTTGYYLTLGLTIAGLILVAIGSGGVKPCMLAFGGEQAKQKSVANFFSLFYFVVNVGTVLATFVTPMLRKADCYDHECYFFGFSLSAFVMIVSLVVFVGGKRFYKIVPCEENLFLKVFQCIGNAISTCHREKSTNPKPHWLDYAEDKHGKKLVRETKILLNVLVLYLPLPIFWALFDQKGSRWTLQAQKLDGDMRFFTLKAEQMQVFNSLLVLVFIPLCNRVVYPLLSFIGIRRPLQKMTFGGVLIGLSFICSMLVQFQIDTYGDGNVLIAAQLPQYALLTLGEVMFAITGLEFSFTQAPESMKSVLQGFWLLTIGFGNLIITVVVATSAIESQATEFLLFACLMFADMLIFMVLGYHYKPIPISELETSVNLITAK